MVYRRCDGDPPMCVGVPPLRRLRSASILDDIGEQTWEENVRGLERLLGGAVYQPGCKKVMAPLTLYHHHVSKTGERKHAIPTTEQFSLVNVKKETSEVIWYLLTVLSRLPQKESSCCGSELGGRGVNILVGHVERSGRHGVDKVPRDCARVKDDDQQQSGVKSTSEG